MTTTDDKTQAQLHRREVLNSIIDLLESLPDKQQQTEIVVSAAAAVGVSVTPPKPPAGRGYAPSHKRNY